MNHFTTFCIFQRLFIIFYCFTTKMFVFGNRDSEATLELTQWASESPLRLKTKKIRKNFKVGISLPSFCFLYLY